MSGSASRSLRVLAGSGRSGTTWLQDALCVANDLHPVFEPFHPQGWSRAGALGRRYAAPQAETNTLGQPSDGSRTGIDLHELEAIWQALLDGSYPSTWIDYRVRPTRLRPTGNDFSSLSSFKRWVGHWRKLVRHRPLYARSPGRSILAKTIRANLLLPVIASRPNTHWALVLRHPAAVIESQLRLKGVWSASRIAAHYASDQALERRLGRSWKSWTGRMRSEAELFTLIWCLENLLPLEDVPQAADHVLFYESLAAHEPSAWDRLLECLGLTHLPTRSVLEKPSQQSTEVLGKSRASKGSALERLDDADRAGIQRVLDMFGVSFYHTDTLSPAPERLGLNRSWRDVA